MMTSRALYTIYEQPVQFKKVFEGLWVSAANVSISPSDEEYFRTVELFREPMVKAEPSAEANVSNQ